MLKPHLPGYGLGERVTPGGDFRVVSDHYRIYEPAQAEGSFDPIPGGHEAPVEGGHGEKVIWSLSAISGDDLMGCMLIQLAGRMTIFVPTLDGVQQMEQYRGHPPPEQIHSTDRARFEGVHDSLLL
jgi:hypothetical protein